MVCFVYFRNFMLNSTETVKVKCTLDSLLYNIMNVWSMINIILLLEGTAISCMSLTCLLFFLASLLTLNFVSSF